MNDLIKIEKTVLNGAETNSVNSRVIYDYLEVATAYSEWIKRAIEKYDFIENEDYIIILTDSKSGKRDYIVSMDMAKELCMVSNTEKELKEFGNLQEQDFKEALKISNNKSLLKQRKAFLLNENQSMLLINLSRNTEIVIRFKVNLTKAFSLMKSKLQENSFTIPKTFSEALLLASKQAEQIEKQNALLLEQKPKVEFFEAVTNSKSAIDMGQVAKVLDKDIGRNKLFEILRNKKILQKDNIPFQTYIDRGYFRVIEVKYTKPDGSTNISLKTLVYQKGVNFINKVLES